MKRGFKNRSVRKFGNLPTCRYLLCKRNSSRFYLSPEILYVSSRCDLHMDLQGLWTEISLGEFFVWEVMQT